MQQKLKKATQRLEHKYCMASTWKPCFQGYREKCGETLPALSHIAQGFENGIDSTILKPLDLVHKQLAWLIKG